MNNRFINSIEKSIDCEQILKSYKYSLNFWKKAAKIKDRRTEKKWTINNIIFMVILTIIQLQSICIMTIRRVKITSGTQLDSQFGEAISIPKKYLPDNALIHLKQVNIVDLKCSEQAVYVVGNIFAQESHASYMTSNKNNDVIFNNLADSELQDS